MFSVLLHSGKEDSLNEEKSRHNLTETAQEMEQAGPRIGAE
jgi:hypothetical protein